MDVLIKADINFKFLSIAFNLNQAPTMEEGQFLVKYILPWFNLNTFAPPDRDPLNKEWLSMYLAYTCEHAQILFADPVSNDLLKELAPKINWNPIYVTHMFADAFRKKDRLYFNDLCRNFNLFNYLPAVIEKLESIVIVMAWAKIFFSKILAIALDVYLPGVPTVRPIDKSFAGVRAGAGAAGLSLGRTIPFAARVKDMMLKEPKRANDKPAI